MKRLMSGMEAVQAGLDRGFGHYSRVVPALERLPNQDAFRLWRSLPGYRKACRMLRRSGRRIRKSERRREALLACARDDRARFEATLSTDLLATMPKLDSDPVTKAAHQSILDEAREAARQRALWAERMREASG